MQENKNGQASTSDRPANEGRNLDKNETLQDAGSAVPDYGRSEQQLNELEEKHGRGARQGNSSIPLDNDETIGNP